MNKQEKDATNYLIEQVQESAINIIQPVMEKSMVFAAEYAKACGRDIVLGEDLEYATEEEIEVIDEDEEDIEFERYSGREYKFVKMNIAYDNWENWVPKNPSEQMLKNAIDSNEHIRA